MAVANSVAGAKAAMDAGVDCYVNTTINGIGERAGNADLLSTVLAFRKSALFQEAGILDKNITINNFYEIAKYASEAFGVPLPINQPGVGENAFAHESGIHADGVLKDRHNYELYEHSELGIPENVTVKTGRVITVGEYSGLKGFRHVCEQIGILLDNKDEDRIFNLARYANVHTQKPLTRRELKFISDYPDAAEKIMTVSPAEKLC